ncbi:MAG: sn-glycerol-3-phosphate ABC transporter substrate-binding protein UgpB [Proteobacteria bacterium]|nr:sn-glycerol-3-phosphate ABC transporter substrate-binding protein UgpB [Pseudomonadota bacterium]
MKTMTAIAVALGAALTAASATAATEINWWHAFTGRLGNLLAEQVETFNASQSEYVVVASHKGNYSETLNAGIAAFRAGEQPHILQVFEVGTATMMAARGAVKPMYQLMAETGTPFDPGAYLAAVAGYYTTTDGEMLSLPYNASTPVLYVNRDAFEAAGLDPDMDLSTWEQVDAALEALVSGGEDCPLVTAWQSWVHLENLSAYHNVPFATRDNGFAGLDTELAFNGPVQVKHIRTMGEWVRDGKFIYTGRRNEGGANFRAGECALFTESSAGYAGVKANAEFAFEIRPLPYWASVEGAPQNTIIGGASLWVMEGHDSEEYAGVAAFLSFLSTSDIQAKWHQDTGYMPITMAAYEQTGASGFYGENPGTDIAIIQMTAKAPTPDSKGLRLGSFDQIRSIIDEELEAVWAGDKTAQEALDSAVERGNRLLRRFEQANR